MKNSVKRLSVSIFVLFVAVCLVATSAYAWFTMSNNPTTGSFDLTVTTTDGLYISASGIDGSYRTSLNAGDILEVYQATPQLDAVYYGDNAGGNDYAFRNIDGGAITSNGSFTQVATYSQYKDYYEEVEPATEITDFVRAENFSLFFNCNITLYKGESADALTSISVVGDVTFGTDKIWTKTQKVEVPNQAYISENTVYQYNAKYYEFNLYFMGSNPYSVYANISSSKVETVDRAATSVGVDLWSTSLAQATYLVGEGLEGNITDVKIHAYASDAYKIGFWNKNSELINIWEPDKALIATTGDLNNLQEGDYAFIQQSSYIQGGTTGDDNIALNYYNDKNNLTGDNRINCTAYGFPTVNQVTVENAGKTHQSALMQLLTLEQVGETTIYKGTLSVKIWIDGWDADCFDSIFDQAVRTSLEFFSK